MVVFKELLLLPRMDDLLYFAALILLIYIDRDAPLFFGT
uniref:Uncharacterized protein n=1 Tax=Rhizophora mucronata TaxID=61149 RepID=A0A2P2QH69_RHIMU